jgi:Domain of unknown function (DUF1877)
MACRGVHFAIAGEELANLLAARNDDEVLLVVQEQIEQPWDESWLYETDKAWEAIHRCLTDGRIGLDNGTDPLRLCILGGRQLHAGDDYIVSLKTPHQVLNLSDSLKAIDEETLRQRYLSIPQADYATALSEEDFAYTRDYFQGLSGFFARAASAGRHVIFTVDQ